MTLQTWTPDKVDQLRNCVVAGLTCSQIAAQIGVTRNAVIGKISRLGLSQARSTATRSHPPRPRRQRHSSRLLLRLLCAEEPGAADEVRLAVGAVDSTKICSLLELSEGKCRWPINEPGAADFAFCGNESIKGFSYCGCHARMAYRFPTGTHATGLGTRA
jgi:GcrA cell cycle regulator